MRRTLLDAAAQVFARRGIDAASLDEVAAEAGLTKGAIYSNFAGKADLVEAMVAENLRTNLDVGLAAVESGGSMAERAQALGDELSRSYLQQPEWHLLFVDLWQRAVRAEQRDGTLLRHRQELRDTITAAIVANADETGTTLPLPPEQLATVLLALSHGFSMEQQLDPAHVPDDLFGRVLALLVRPE
ncbi:TetR family transcriptional regulator [Nocardioides marmoraquaticus]